MIYADDTVTNQWNTIARGVAQRNGYVDGVNGVTVNVQRLDDRKLRVTIGKNGSQFFTKLVLGSVPMNRKATAEFVLPIPLGSPLNTFGNQTLTATAPNFWAAIAGPTRLGPTATSMPPSASTARVETACSSTNPRVPGVGLPLRHPGAQRGRPAASSSTCSTPGVLASRGANRWRPAIGDYGDGSYLAVATRYELYDQDGTPLIPDDNPTASCGDVACQRRLRHPARQTRQRGDALQRTPG